MRKLIFVYILSMVLTLSAPAYASDDEIINVYPANPEYSDSDSEYTVGFDIENNGYSGDYVMVGALYDGDKKLIGTSIISKEQAESISGGSLTIKTDNQDAYYEKFFVWNSTNGIKPVRDPIVLGIDGLLAGQLDGKPMDSAERLLIYLFDKAGYERDDIAEVKIVCPEQVYTWVPELLVYEDNENSAVDIVNNEIEIKENGMYLVYVKDTAGVQYVDWVNVDTITSPEFTLSATTNEDATKATISVNITKQNTNAPITDMVWSDDFEQLPGDYRTINNLVKAEIINNADNVIQNNSFDVTSNGTYTVFVRDEWGNSCKQSIEVTTLAESQ